MDASQHPSAITPALTDEQRGAIFSERVEDGAQVLDVREMARLHALTVQATLDCLDGGGRVLPRREHQDAVQRG